MLAFWISIDPPARTRKCMVLWSLETKCVPRPSFIHSINWIREAPGWLEEGKVARWLWFATSAGTVLEWYAVCLIVDADSYHVKKYGDGALKACFLTNVRLLWSLSLRSRHKVSIRWCSRYKRSVEGSKIRINLSMGLNSCKKNTWK